MPICIRQADKIKARRQWANNACLDAEKPGYFINLGSTTSFAQPGRKLRRVDPSNN